MDLYILLIIIALVAMGTVVLISNKVADNLYWGALALIFFLPFERIPTFELAGFTLKINHILGWIVLSWWAFDFHIKKRDKKNRTNNPLAFALWIFVLTQAISLAQALNPIRSIAFFLLTLFCIGLFAFVYDLVKRQVELEKIEKVILISTWIVVIFSLWQFVGDMAGLPLWATGLLKGYSKITFGFPRVQAFSREPLYLGNFLMIPLGFLVGRIIAGQKMTISKILLLLGVFSVMILTLSRGAYLGFFFFAITAFTLAPRKMFLPKVLVAIKSMVIILAIGLYFVLLGLGPDKKQRFVDHVLVSDFNYSESVVGRLGASAQALELWKQSPIFGIGLGNYGAYTAGKDPEAPEAGNIVNNQYVEVLTESGIIGLASFLGVIVILLANAYRAWATTSKMTPTKGLLIGLTASYIGILVQYNFFSTTAIIHIWVLMGLLLATSRIVAVKQYH